MNKIKNISTTSVLLLLALLLTSCNKSELEVMNIVYGSEKIELYYHLPLTVGDMITLNVDGDSLNGGITYITKDSILLDSVTHLPFFLGFSFNTSGSHTIKFTKQSFAPIEIPITVEK